MGKKVTMRAKYIKEKDRMPYFARDDGSYLKIEDHIEKSFKLKDGDILWVIILKED